VRIVISSGHARDCPGASGIIDEVDEARRVVNAVAEALESAGVEVKTFHDDVSDSQQENLNRIVDYHNAQARELDVSVHFNAYEETEAPMGTECLYVTQEAKAAEVAFVISEASGLKNRGPKKRTDLFFLNNTEEPAILIEVCFVDSTSDVFIYQACFDAVCIAIAEAISGQTIEAPPFHPPRP
jgi:N-acetylmuramoyl-L-alanine amidase